MTSALQTLTRYFSLTAIVFSLLASARAASETYVIDRVHSSVGFSIRHFFSKVPGSFTKFEGAIVVDREHLENSSVEVTIDIASVNTASIKRDDHLRSPDFFDAAKFASITFKSKSWKKTGEATFDVTGDLTLKGVTKEVVLKVRALGFGPGMRPGSQLSGWEATTTLQRSDFGVAGFDKMLGEDVDVHINVEAGVKA
jgi:polyisoprenoid-binding protein YceI